MPSASRWDAPQYLKFERERTLPCRDLVGRLELEAPARIADLGCGPGNSTSVLQRRWPGASIVGVDSSPEMLETARRTLPGVGWVRADLREWVPAEPYDLLFSNAALHWVEDHPRELRRLWGFVAPGGALAFQVPFRRDPLPPWTEAWNELRARPRWAGAPLDDLVRTTVLPPSEYYDLFAPQARRVELWDTEYCHVLPGPEAIVEWVRGTSLRPSLSRLGRDADREELLRDFRAEVARRYPARRSGEVLFPFLRRFVIAYR